jgi:hypothetical protein
MQALRFLFLPSGRLRPRPFVAGVIGVYLAGAASHLLTMPDLIARAGLWPFATVQAILTWVWFALHGKRLRDAGRGVGLAAAVSVLYALAVALLLIVAAAFFNASAGAVPDANARGALGLILLVEIAAILLGAPSHDLAWVMVTILIAMALVPIVLALVVTLWAATRPSAKEPSAEEPGAKEPWA